jgi:hypothetical protein
MVSGVGFGQGVVSRPVGVVDAAASTVLRRLGQSVGGLAGTSSERQASLNLNEGRAALAGAVDAAGTVIDRLGDLRDRIAIARDLRVPSVRGDSNVYALQAEVSQLVKALDGAVADAGAAGVNLIGSPAANVRISSPNGVVAVTVQPLSSRELGVSSLDLTSPSGVEQAFTAVQSALVVATSRREMLAAVRDELGNAQGFTATLAGTLRGLSLGATGRELRVGAALDIRA